jgi:hypothetical protein
MREQDSPPQSPSLLRKEGEIVMRKRCADAKVFKAPSLTKNIISAKNLDSALLERGFGGESLPD